MNVEGKSNLPTAVPVITSGSAYAAGNLLGGLLTLSQAFQRPQTGIVYSVTISDKAKQDSAIDVIFFKNKPAGTFTDKTAFAPSAADLALICGVAKITGAMYSDFNANSAASLLAAGLVVQNTVNNVPGQLTTPDFNLYCALVCRGTPTFASASDLQLTVGIIQD